MERSIWMSVSITVIMTIGVAESLRAESFFSRVVAWCTGRTGQDKALDGATLETIQFYVPQEPGSNHFIARKGVLLKRPSARGVIVICHGYSCDKFDAAFLRMMFPDFHVLTFDFRAHGEHVDVEHQCTFGKHEAYEVTAAAQFVKTHPELQKLPCIAYGFSMGAVAAIQAQALDGGLFTAMVLDCPYDDSQNIIKRGLEQLKITVGGYTIELPGKDFLERNAFSPYVQMFLKQILKVATCMDATATNTQLMPLSPRDLIRHVTVPCFFIHCAHDDKISVQSIQNVYANAPGFKRLWVTDGRRHFDSFFYNPEWYRYKINKFISMIVDGSYASKVTAKKRFDVQEDEAEINNKKGRS
jgi:pimeloyl-ACP methyl ester carboxylesterase